MRVERYLDEARCTSGTVKSHERSRKFVSWPFEWGKSIKARQDRGSLFSGSTSRVGKPGDIEEISVPLCRKLPEDGEKVFSSSERGQKRRKMAKRGAGRRFFPLRATTPWRIGPKFSQSVEETRVHVLRVKMARSKKKRKKKPGRGLTRTSSWRCDRNVGLDESFRMGVLCRSLLFFFFFWTLKIFGKKCPTERPADRGISRPAGREWLADWGISRPAGRERSADRRFSRVITSLGRKWRYLGRKGRSRVFYPALGREPSADEGFAGGITSWTLKTISKSALGRDPPTGVSLDRRVENDSPRRWRIFQRNHLFDFVKISKYFKVRSWKRPAHRGLRRPAGRERLADGGLSRPAGREGSADEGFAGGITSWTLKSISKSALGRDPPTGVSLDRRVENHPRADEAFAGGRNQLLDFENVCQNSPAREITAAPKTEGRGIVEPRKNLSRSWRHGHSAAYNTSFSFKSSAKDRRARDAPGTAVGYAFRAADRAPISGRPSAGPERIRT